MDILYWCGATNFDGGTVGYSGADIKLIAGVLNGISGIINGWLLYIRWQIPSANIINVYVGPSGVSVQL